MSEIDTKSRSYRIRKQFTASFGPSIKAGNVTAAARFAADESVILPLSNAAKLVEESARQVEEAARRTTADTTRTDDAKTLDLRQFVKKQDRLVTESVNKRAREAEGAKRQLEEKLQEIARPPKDTAMASEIRRYVSSLSKSARRRFLDEHLDDYVTLNAIFSAKPYLSGLDEGERRELLHAFQQRHMPGEKRKLDTLVTAETRLARAYDAWLSGISPLVNAGKDAAARRAAADEILNAPVSDTWQDAQ